MKWFKSNYRSDTDSATKTDKVTIRAAIISAVAIIFATIIGVFITHFFTSGLYRREIDRLNEIIHKFEISRIDEERAQRFKDGSEHESFRIISGEYLAEIAVRTFDAFRGVYTSSFSNSHSEWENVRFNFISNDKLVIPFIVTIEIIEGSGMRYFHYSFEGQSGLYFNVYCFSAERWTGARTSENLQRVMQLLRRPDDSPPFSVSDVFSIYGYIAISEFFTSANPTGNSTLIFDYLDAFLGFNDSANLPKTLSAYFIRMT